MTAADHQPATAGSPQFIDLHAHSTASDGAASPSELVAAARQAGLSAIALTDHDSVAGVGEATAAGAAAGVRVVAGVELSAVDAAGETHLLGLHVADLAALDARLAELRDMRRTRAERIVQRLNALGVRVTVDDVLAHAAGGAIGRPHVARAIVAKGWAPDIRTAFDRYLGAGRPAFVAKDRLSLAEAIGIVHRAAGLAVLAHPGPSATPDRLKALIALGLDGVEVRHPSHDDAEIGRILSVSERLGLLPSGGSDWHGQADGARALGAMHVPAEWLARQDARLARRGSREWVA
ncbi:MAG: PHP domain-containing protein [Gemmatimonadaceae bacterium]